VHASRSLPDVRTQLAAAEQALAAGRVADAEQICREVIAIAPDHARVWILLTEAALCRNRLDAAIVCANRAVALAPSDPIAHVIQAKCLAQSGDTQGALVASEVALKLGQERPEVNDSIGAIFGFLGRHDRAASLFTQAIAERPHNAQFLYNLAATERMTGDLTAAEKHCDRVIASDPHFYRAYYLRSDLRIHSSTDNHIAEMETLIAGGVRNWEGEVLLRYALGKECENVGDIARSFAHIKAGADLQRRHLDYDVRTDIAVINEIIKTHTLPALRPMQDCCDDAPVFIVGLPRSGTTLVERIISSHPAINSGGELGAFPLVLSQLANDGRPPNALPSELVKRWLSVEPAALGRRYMTAARAVASLSSGRFIDKLPINYLHCGLLHRALPNARIILVRRQAMDSCYALYKTLFHETNLFSYDFKELAAYFTAFRLLAEHWKATLPKHAFIEVAYEDIVLAPRDEARRLLAFLNLPWDDAVLRFESSSAPSATASAVQVRRPLYASSIGLWRNLEKELAPLRAALAGLAGN
jgi:Flp pilus assembly protein TadD